jgi:hypothetical protein
MMSDECGMMNGTVGARHFLKGIESSKRHSREGGNPVVSVWESGIKGEEGHGDLSVLSDSTTMGIVAPGFPPSRE